MSNQSRLESALKNTRRTLKGHMSSWTRYAWDAHTRKDISPGATESERAALQAKANAYRAVVNDARDVLEGLHRAEQLLLLESRQAEAELSSSPAPRYTESQIRTVLSQMMVLDEGGSFDTWEVGGVRRLVDDVIKALAGMEQNG